MKLVLWFRCSLRNEHSFTYSEILNVSLKLRILTLQYFISKGK